MKKAFLAVSLLLLSWGSLQAQDFRLGLKAGFNYTNVSGNMGQYQDFDKDRLAGFSAGVITNFTASDLLAVQGELAYATKGFRIDDTRTADNGTTTTQTEITSRINYLDLPLLVQVRASHLFFEAGPQFSFLLNQQTETRRTITEKELVGETVTKEPVGRNTSTSGYKTVDPGYVVGLGFRSDNSPISVGLRYSSSLASFLETAKTDARHSFFQVSVSSYLPFFGE